MRQDQFRHLGHLQGGVLGDPVPQLGVFADQDPFLLREGTGPEGCLGGKADHAQVVVGAEPIQQEPVLLGEPQPLRHGGAEGPQGPDVFLRLHGAPPQPVQEDPHDEAAPVLPGPHLPAVHRLLRLADQGGQARLPLGLGGRAEGDGEGDPVDRRGGGLVGLDPPDDRLSRRLVRPGEEEDELVAPPSGQDVLLPGAAPKDVRRRREEPIPLLVAEGVVGQLQRVHVPDQDRQGKLAGNVQPTGLLLEKTPVVEAGEGIVVGEEPDPLLRRPPLGDVPIDHRGGVDLSRRIPDRGDRDLHADAAPVPLEGILEAARDASLQGLPDPLRPEADLLGQVREEVPHAAVQHVLLEEVQLLQEGPIGVETAKPPVPEDDRLDGGVEDRRHVGLPGIRILLETVSLPVRRRRALRGSAVGVQLLLGPVEQGHLLHQLPVQVPHQGEELLVLEHRGQAVEDDREEDQGDVRNVLGGAGHQPHEHAHDPAGGGEDVEADPVPRAGGGGPDRPAPLDGPGEGPVLHQELLLPIQQGRGGLGLGVGQHEGGESLPHRVEAEGVEGDHRPDPGSGLLQQGFGRRLPVEPGGGIEPQGRVQGREGLHLLPGDRLQALLQIADAKPIVHQRSPPPKKTCSISRTCRSAWSRIGSRAFGERESSSGASGARGGRTWAPLEPSRFATARRSAT